MATFSTRYNIKRSRKTHWSALNLFVTHNIRYITRWINTTIFICSFSIFFTNVRNKIPQETLSLFRADEWTSWWKEIVPNTNRLLPSTVAMLWRYFKKIYYYKYVLPPFVSCTSNYIPLKPFHKLHTHSNTLLGDQKQGNPTLEAFDIASGLFLFKPRLWFEA